MKTQKTDSPILLYGHLVWFAVAYGVAIGFLMLVRSSLYSIGGVDIPVLMAIFAIAFSTVVLTAAWSVFGPGGYFKRVAAAHCFALIVAVGAGLGVELVYVTTSSTSNVPGFFGWGVREIFANVTVWLLAIPTISMMAQLPFWFCRMFFGWQFVYGETPPEKLCSLRDGFLVTFLFAVAFAAPQLTVNLDVFGVESMPAYEITMVTQEDGTESYEQVPLTDQEIESRRRQNVQAHKFLIQMWYLGAAAYTSVISLLGVPVVVFVFRSRSTQAGGAWTLVYSGGWVLLVLMFVIAGTWGASGVGRGVFLTSLTLGVMGPALWGPLAVSRVVGFRLTSPRRYQQELLRSSELLKSRQGLTSDRGNQAEMDGQTE